MSVLSVLRQAGRKTVAGLAALATAASVMVAGAGAASAHPNRDWLRPDATGLCEWDPAMYWVQRCDVWSDAMGRNVPVQIQPAGRGGNAALYLLDGMRATEFGNAWLYETNAAAEYVDHNITLAMPVGGAASFYADWRGPATYDPFNYITYKWETFLTEELPAYLEQHFGVARNNNSILGLSMGGSSALNLAAKHGDQFRQALSFSGYLTLTMPGWQTMIRVAMLDVGLFNINAMYGSLLSADRFINDPFWNMEGLRGTDVYVSAGSGIPGQPDFAYPIGDQIAGAGLEAISRISTMEWALKARAQGIPFAEDYPALGIHNWENFSNQLRKTKERVLNVMNAW